MGKPFTAKQDCPASAKCIIPNTGGWFSWCVNLMRMNIAQEFLFLSGKKHVMIKGDFGAKAKKIEIKDKSNATYTTYSGEGQIGKINFAKGAFFS